MPTFSMILLLPKMNNAGLKETLKRSAGYIFEIGGTLRKIENLGFQKLPYYIRANGMKNTEAHHFLMDFDASLTHQGTLMDKFKRDKEIVRATSFVMSSSPENLFMKKQKSECTLWQDLLPLPERPDVLKLMNTRSRKEKIADLHKFKYDGSGKDWSVL